jgi:hypothetical protein
MRVMTAASRRVGFCCTVSVFFNELVGIDACCQEAPPGGGARSGLLALSRDTPLFALSTSSVSSRVFDTLPEPPTGPHHAPEHVSQFA